MTESLPRSERHREKPAKAEKTAAPKRAAVAAPVLITVRGQRYVAPAGRHSQQTHRRAAERAAAEGFTTVKELHAHDRSLIVAEISRKAQALIQQKQQSSGGPKPKPQAAPQE